MDPSMREALEDIRQTWREESDEAVFEALTAGRAKYTDAALGVIADEAARRGITRPERMKQLAQAHKADQAEIPQNSDTSNIQSTDPVTLLGQAIAAILVFAAMIAFRIWLRRLF